MTELLNRLFEVPGEEEWFLFGIVLFGLVGFVGASELVRRVFQWSPEFNRKLVHVCVGILIFFAPSLFTSAVPVMLLAMIFIVVNLLAIRFGGEGGVVLAAASVASVRGTAWEGLSSPRLDNLSIPLLSVAFVLSSCHLPGQGDIQRFVVGAILALVIAAAGWKTRALAPSGAVATFVLAVLLFGTGGWKWTVPILTFFVLSSVLSRLGKQRKQEAESMFEKGTTRDYGQVFANGGIAGIIALANYMFPSVDLYPAFLGSIAAVTADTWGTEIGLASKRRPWLVTSWKRVEPGTNGGVTMPGLLGGLAGSIVIAASALAWVDHGWMLVPILIAGIGGSFVDSLAGATVQAEYRCPVCGKPTEKRVHCNSQPTHQRRGVEWITNDVVNWVCAAAGALIALGLMRFFDVFERTRSLLFLN